MHANNEQLKNINKSRENWNPENCHSS